MPRLATGAGAWPCSFLPGMVASQPDARPHSSGRGSGGICGLGGPRQGHWALGSPLPTMPPPPAEGATQNSQRDLYPVRGDRRGRAWDSPEVAGREWGRLKHIVGHGAHFFLGWGWSGGHRKSSVRSHCLQYCPQQFKDRTRQDRQAPWEGSERLTCVGPHGDFPGWHPVPPPVLTLPDRKMGPQELHKVAQPIPLMGLLAEHGQGQVTPPSSQATGYPVPCPEGPHPMLALLKNEESNVSPPSTTSSSRKLG